VYSSSLTSTIAFYLYLYLGLDGDSFARMGGSPYYAKAQDIVNLGQNERERGWKAFESQKNRYWLIENLTNPTYASVRDAMYKYHRLGLDLMSDDVEVWNCCARPTGNDRACLFCSFFLKQNAMNW
jgi:hypothetical protein